MLFPFCCLFSKTWHFFLPNLLRFGFFCLTLPVKEAPSVSARAPSGVLALSKSVRVLFKSVRYERLTGAFLFI